MSKEIDLNCFRHSSGKKFRSGQISVSTSVHEHGDFLYPSITFCPKFKEAQDLVEILEEKQEENVAIRDIKDLDFDQLITDISYEKDEFLSIFSHPENGDPRTGTGVMNNDTHWVESIPHPKVGRLRSLNIPICQLKRD